MQTLAVQCPCIIYHQLDDVSFFTILKLLGRRWTGLRTCVHIYGYKL